MNDDPSQRAPARSRVPRKVEIPAMRSLPRLSIGRLMGFIALFAVEMALLQRLLLKIVTIPPITMGIVSMNLAILYALRWLPRSMVRRIEGMLCGGMIALFLLVGYYLLAVPIYSPVGAVGARIAGFLNNLAGSRTDPSDAASSVLRQGVRLAFVVEIVLLDLFGLAVIWVGGWLAGRRHVGVPERPAAAQEHPSPLDDRVATPL